MTKNGKLLAVNLEVGYTLPVSELACIVASVGFDGGFLAWYDGVDLAAHAKSVRDAGLILQSVHAPFRGMQTVWEKGEAGDAMINTLIECLSDCAQVDAPVMVLHPIIGMDRHTPTELGLSRLSHLVEAAEKTSVRLAFENVEGQEYLDAVMNRFDSPSVGFCWDTGHEMCYNFSHDMMALYGDRLIATHLNDNLGITDPEHLTWHDDLHQLPFDGKADWQGIVNRLKRHSYDGILSFEMVLHNRPNRHTHDEYEAWTTEEYFANVLERARRVADLF